MNSHHSRSSLTLSLPAIVLLTVAAIFTGRGLAQQQSSVQDNPWTFSAEATLTSKYMWRGQRLTNDWSLQPAATVGFKGFSFNIWSTVDLTAVHEGRNAFLPENPDAPPGTHRGLQGRMSEVDYTVAYSRSIENVTLNAGLYTYTFPRRPIAATSELFGGITLDSVPFSPSATLYVDVDESIEKGATGLYFALGGRQAWELKHRVFTGVELSALLGFSNNGFANLCYGASHAGLHDVSLTAALPLKISERWSARAFASYGSLLGSFRNYQLADERLLYLGTAKPPSEYADTFWGGFTVAASF
jgi:hypothetical protein